VPLLLLAPPVVSLPGVPLLVPVPAVMVVVVSG
jgi:hypothetical protein